MNQKRLYPITTSEQVLLDNNKTLKQNLGSANGIATLNEKGKIPANQLPDSLADITEYDNTVSGLEAQTVQDAIDELALRPAGSAFTLKAVETLPTEDIDSTTIYLKLKISGASWHYYQSGWQEFETDPVLFAIDELPETANDWQGCILYNNQESTWTYYQYENGEWVGSTSGVIGDSLDVGSWTCIIVDTLPDDPEQSSTYYLLLNESDYFDEYLYTGGHWEVIGSTQVDLTNYISKDELVTIVNALPSEGESGKIYCIPKTVTATKYSQQRTYIGNGTYEYADPVKLTDTLEFKLVETLPEVGETDVNYIWWNDGWKQSYYTDQWTTTSFSFNIKDQTDATLTYVKSTSGSTPSVIQPTIGAVSTIYWYQLDSERLYDEYIFIDKHFEPIQQDLSSFAQKSDLEDYVTKDTLADKEKNIWVEVAALPEITYEQYEIQGDADFAPQYDYIEYEQYQGNTYVSSSIYASSSYGFEFEYLPEESVCNIWMLNENGEQDYDLDLSRLSSMFPAYDNEDFATTEWIIENMHDWWGEDSESILIVPREVLRTPQGIEQLLVLTPEGDIVQATAELMQQCTYAIIPVIYQATPTTVLINGSPVPPQHNFYKIKSGITAYIPGSDQVIQIISDDSQIEAGNNIYLNYTANTVTGTGTFQDTTFKLLYNVESDSDLTNTDVVCNFHYRHYVYNSNGYFEEVFKNESDFITEVTVSEFLNLSNFDYSQKYLITDYGNFNLLVTPGSKEVKALKNGFSNQAWDTDKWKVTIDEQTVQTATQVIVIQENDSNTYWRWGQLPSTGATAGEKAFILQETVGDTTGLTKINNEFSGETYYNEFFTWNSLNSNCIYYVQFDNIATSGYMYGTIYEYAPVTNYLGNIVSYTVRNTEIQFPFLSIYATNVTESKQLIITRLVDEYNNSIPWDFKQLLYTTINVPYTVAVTNLWKVSEVFTNPSFNASYYIWSNSNETKFICTTDPTSTEYYYTSTNPAIVDPAYSSGASLVNVLYTSGQSDLTYKSQQSNGYTLGGTTDLSVDGTAHDVIIEDGCSDIKVIGTPTNVIFKSGIVNFTVTGNISNIIFDSNPVSELTLTYTGNTLKAYPNNFARELMYDSLEARLATHNVGDKTTYEGVTYIKRQEINYFVPYMTSNNTTVYAYLAWEPSYSDYNYLVTPLHKFYTQPSLDSSYYIYEFTPDGSDLIYVDSTDTTNSTGSDSSYILSSTGSDYFTHQQVNGQDYITQTIYYWEQVDATKYITASTYKYNTLYKEGDYCIILGELYKCTDTYSFTYDQYDIVKYTEVGQDNTSIDESSEVVYKGILFFFDSSWADSQQTLGDLSISELRSVDKEFIDNYFTKVTSLDDNTVYKIVLNENSDCLDLPALPTSNKEGLFIQITNTTASNISVNTPYTKWVNSQPSNIYATNESTVNICALDNICTLNYIIETT